jgi:Uma2 family endonuclease
MHMAVQSQLITAEDLLRMPADGFRYELVRGELRKMTPAGHQHGRIAINITTPLAQHVRAHNLGVVYAAETGFRLATDPDTVRAPDVAFIRRDRVEAVGDTEGYWPGAPDLAVEVISPSDTYTEVEEKIFDWLDAGVRLVIAANPRQHTVTVYRSRADIVLLTEDDTLDGDVVPGWILPVREVFR